MYWSDIFSHSIPQQRVDPENGETQENYFGDERQTKYVQREPEGCHSLIFHRCTWSTGKIQEA